MFFRMTTPVLICDDSSVARKQMARTLPSDWDIEISFAKHGEEALTAKRRLDVNGSFGCSLICRFCWHLGTAGDMQYVDNDDGDVVFSYNRSVRNHSPKYIVDMVKHFHEKHQNFSGKFFGDQKISKNLKNFEKF